MSLVLPLPGSPLTRSSRPRPAKAASNPSRSCVISRVRPTNTPLASRSSGHLFKVDGYVVAGERIILPLAEDGQTADGVLGVSDYTPPPLMGTLELILENPEWYAI